MEDTRETLKNIWTQAGEKLLELKPKLTTSQLVRVLNRITPAFDNSDVMLGLPVYRDVEFQTMLSIMDLLYVGGLAGVGYQNFEIASCREYLLDFAIQHEFKRLLFLDSDTVIDLNGFKQLMDTMDRMECAMVAAPVIRRGEDGSEVTVNAFVGVTGDMRPMTSSDLPTTWVPIPCHYVGLAAALIDVTKVKKFPGPRFVRRAEGYKHTSEDWAFCRWLEHYELDFLVDPKVSTSHVIATEIKYQRPKSE